MHPHALLDLKKIFYRIDHENLEESYGLPTLMIVVPLVQIERSFHAHVVLVLTENRIEEIGEKERSSEPPRRAVREWR